MHEDLLMKVIKDQAGTLEKGILEGVMNLIEAGATRGDIGLIIEGDKGLLTIDDDGQGITTKEEIIANFEQFGTPHDESENKIWAKFRMGRGQLFAFGQNIWRTATFEMIVDIKNWGLTYHLKENLPYVNGCHITIELYDNPICDWKYPSIERFKDEIKELVEFVSTPIYFNNERVSVPPKELQWDEEDEFAYYLFHMGDKVCFYNLGAKVMEKSSWTLGVSGIVVSKQQLDVNFARNDVKSSCPIYRGIGEVIKRNRINETKEQKKYTAMTSAHRYVLLVDMRDAVQPLRDLRGKRIFKTAQGKYWTLNMLIKNNQEWTFAPDGCRIADKGMERGSTVCLSESILHKFNYSGEKKDFFSWLLKEQLREDNYYGGSSSYERNVFSWEREEIDNFLIQKSKIYIPYSVAEASRMGVRRCLQDGFSDTYRTLPHNKMTIVEKRILQILADYKCWQNRSICLGVSDTASAWTDGDSCIVLERTFLKNIDLHYKHDVHRLFAVMIHELAHDDNTEGTHRHSPEFDANFRTIIESRTSPFSNILIFFDKMRNAQMEIKKAREDTKEREKKDKRAKRLGLEESSIAAKNK